MAFINFDKRIIKKVLNYLLIAFLIFIIISPNGKAWVLRQFISVGLFKAEIKKDAVKDLPANSTFSFTDSNGNNNNTSLLEGKVVFINFWASWCPPCRAEMPSINELYKKLQSDTNFVFLSINEDDDKIESRCIFREQSFSISQYFMLREMCLAKYLQVRYPQQLFLIKKVEIVLKHEGLAGYNSDSFLRQLKELQ